MHPNGTQMVQKSVKYIQINTIIYIKYEGMSCIPVYQMTTDTPLQPSSIHHKQTLFDHWKQFIDMKTTIEANW